MNRTRLLVATAFAAVLFAASAASAATVTFTFFSGMQPDNVTPIVPDLPTNIGNNINGDLCPTGDYCAEMLRFVKNGVTLEVTANGTDRLPPFYVNEDLSPVWGGLGVDGGSPNPGSDNNGPGEVLELTFSVPVKLKSFVAFRDHTNFFRGSGNPQVPTQILVMNQSLASRVFNVPVNNPVGPGTPLPQMGDSLFTFAPTFAGSVFDFSINAETFYISQLTIQTQNVPEPSSLLMLGMAVLGGARVYRRRTAA